jgi:hypothetical protein
MKMDRVARKLAVGFESFKIINQPKTDVNLRFSSNNMQRMAALLDPTEQDEFLLLWRPHVGAASSTAAPATVPGAAPRFALPAAKGLRSPSATCLEEGIIKVATDVPVSAASSTSSRVAASELSPSGTCSDAELVSSDGECDAASHSSGSTPTLPPRAHKQHGAKLSAEAKEELRKMREVPIEWRAFHINMGAFLYCTQFKMPLPPAVMPIIKPEVGRWLNIKPEDMVVQHHFTLYK